MAKTCVMKKVKWKYSQQYILPFKSAKKFIELFDKNFYKRVGSQSLKSKMDTAAKKKQTLIKDEDVKKINYGLLNDIEEDEKELIANPCEKNYFKLSDSLEAYELVYNRKRSGDIGKYFDIFLLTLFSGFFKLESWVLSKISIEVRFSLT